MKITLNRKRRTLAATIFEACVAATIVIIIGGTAVVIIVKLCKKLDRQREHDRTNQTDTVTMEMPPGWIHPTDVKPALAFDLLSSNAIPFNMAIQESPDLTNWHTFSYMTGAIESLTVPLTILDENHNVLRTEYVPLLPSIQPKLPIVRDGTNQMFYRIVEVK